MRTFYIVEHYEISIQGELKVAHWQAHKRGVCSMLNIFGAINMVPDTITIQSADICEKRLRYKYSKESKFKIIRVVKL